MSSSSSSSSWLPVTVELFKYLVQRVCGCVVFILIGRLCSSETNKKKNRTLAERWPPVLFCSIFIYAVSYVTFICFNWNSLQLAS